jgi:hypothetical protein
MPLKVFPVLPATVAHAEMTVEIAALALLVPAVASVLADLKVVVATVAVLQLRPLLLPRHNCSFFN